MPRPEAHDIMEIPPKYDTTGVTGRDDLTEAWGNTDLSDTAMLDEPMEVDNTTEANRSPEVEPEVEPPHYIYYLAIIKDGITNPVTKSHFSSVEKFRGPFKNYDDVLDDEDFKAERAAGQKFNYTTWTNEFNPKIAFIDEPEFQDQDILNFNFYKATDTYFQFPRTVLRIFRENNKEVFDCGPSTVVYPIVSNGPVGWGSMGALGGIAKIDLNPARPWTVPGWGMSLRLHRTFMSKREAYSGGLDHLQQIAGRSGPIALNFNDTSFQHNGELLLVYEDIGNERVTSVCGHRRVEDASELPANEPRGSLSEWRPQQPQGRDTRV
ncbi:hypothetical protein IQ07DRAFT_658007 [Pyrenochaeta sp. DS3sAY3a]|nr:hypothetical protein IQ07DRAFT_658007 [Pyrenochaeta sp. DS3sAY3a]